jgi:hypothetical protein
MFLPEMLIVEWRALNGLISMTRRNIDQALAETKFTII